MTFDTSTLMDGALQFLAMPMSKDGNITWGFFIAVIVFIWFIANAGGK